MNWLAHLHLSEPCIHFQLGNLLADLMKGQAWEGIHPGTRNGFERHKAIDAFTDSHPLFKQSVSRLGDAGHLRGVVADLAYDHFLSRHWTQYSTHPLEPFLETFYQSASKAIVDYPPQALRFVRAVIRSNRLGSYGELGGIHDAMRCIDRRLSDRVRKRETTTAYFPKLTQAYQQIESDFLQFFPSIVEFTRFEMHSPPIK